jgi:hypothetical protein
MRVPKRCFNRRPCGAVVLARRQQLRWALVLNATIGALWALFTLAGMLFFTGAKALGQRSILSLQSMTSEIVAVRQPERQL